MTTLQDLINETKGYLFTGNVEEMNVLNGAISSTSATTFAMTYALGGITPGSVIGIDLELILILATSATTMQVTNCVRGFLGSTPATHSNGAIITVRPKFPDFMIARSLNEEIADLSSPENGLYQMKTATDITYNPAIEGYNLAGATNIIDIYQMHYKQVGPENNWPAIRYWRLERDMSASEFASGYAVFIQSQAQPGNPIRVQYKAEFTPWTTLTTANLTDDIQAVVGLPASANDIPPIGVAIRLVAGREIKRNFTETQGEPRRSEEVPAGANLRSAALLDQLRNRRIMAEATRLDRKYPELRY